MPRYTEEQIAQAASKQRSKIRTIKARFDGTCPQCKRPMPKGSDIGCTYDNVWRCMDCTKVFAYVGPRGGRFLDQEELLADRRRVEMIYFANPVTNLWNSAKWHVGDLAQWEGSCDPYMHRMYHGTIVAVYPDHVDIEDNEWHAISGVPFFKLQPWDGN